MYFFKSTGGADSDLFFLQKWTNSFFSTPLEFTVLSSFNKAFPTTTSPLHREVRNSAILQTTQLSSCHTRLLPILSVLTLSKVSQLILQFLLPSPIACCFRISKLGIQNGILLWLELEFWTPLQLLWNQI